MHARCLPGGGLCAHAWSRLPVGVCMHTQSRRGMHPPGETFGSDWLDALRAVGSGCAELGNSLDVVIMGDFGRDQDDEKALAMAVAMRRLGLIGNLSVVANLGDSLARARLAKGTVSVLGAHDVPVARGSGTTEKQAAYEFHCPYLASEEEIVQVRG